MRLIEINGNEGAAEAFGVRREVRLDFIDSPALDEYVIVHAGFAIERLDPERARESLDAFREVNDALGR